MTAILLYGDTVRYPAIRHEIPLEIIDPLLVAVENGRTSILTSSLESARITEAVPDAELVLLDELGFYEMLADGVERDEAELEVVLRAVQRWGIERRSCRRPARRGRRQAARRRRADRGRRQGRRGPPPREDRGRAGGHPPRPARRRARDGGRATR